MAAAHDCSVAAMVLVDCSCGVTEAKDKESAIASVKETSV